MSDCQPGGSTFFMYGWVALLKAKMSMTSTSLAIRRVCVLVMSSFAFTTAMSIVTFGYFAWNCSLNVFMKSTNGGFWCTRTRSVPDSAGAALSAGAAVSPGAGVAAGADVGAVVAAEPPHAATASPAIARPTKSLRIGCFAASSRGRHRRPALTGTAGCVD